LSSFAYPALEFSHNLYFCYTWYSVDALLSGKYLYYPVANIFRTVTKFYHNQQSFVDDVTKSLVCCFSFTIPIAFHLQNANANFHKVSFRWGKKCLHYCMANLLRTIHTNSSRPINQLSLIGQAA